MPGSRDMILQKTNQDRDRSAACNAVKNKNYSDRSYSDRSYSDKSYPDNTANTNNLPAPYSNTNTPYSNTNTPYNSDNKNPIYRTTKQAVDAQVKLLKAEHPLSGLFREQEEERRLLEEDKKSREKSGGIGGMDRIGGTRASATSATSLGVGGIEPPAAGNNRLLNKPTIMSSADYTRANFTKPAYMHARDKHYKGSGVAQLLGGGF